MRDLVDKYLHGLIALWAFVLMQWYTAPHGYSIVEAAAIWTLSFTVTAVVVIGFIHVFGRENRHD